jgi:hypothetical protein
MQKSEKKVAQWGNFWCFQKVSLVYRRVGTGAGAAEVGVASKFLSGARAVTASKIMRLLNTALKKSFILSIFRYYPII